MARRFKRRKPRVLWLPIHGEDLSTGESNEFLGGLGGNLSSINDDGIFDTQFTDVTFDYSDAASSEEGVDFRSLHELSSGNGYRLRRIVGKMFVSCTMEANSLAGIPLVICGAGFIINRTDPSGNPLLSNTLVANQTPFGPLHQDALEDPWIWRRTWLLSPIAPQVAGSPGASLYAQQIAINTATGPGHALFPNTNVAYGSVADGPHIDQKTARIIGPQERLFFWVQAKQLTYGPGAYNVAHINWHLDVRLLASLRTMVGNRRNASR